MQSALKNREWVRLEAVGPESFDFTVTTNALIWDLIHYRWYTFLADAVVTERVCGICAHLAQVLNAPMVLYLPDSFDKASRAYETLCDQGVSVAEAHQWLMKNCGPPAQKISDLITSDDKVVQCGYFVDEFTSLTRK